MTKLRCEGCFAIESKRLDTDYRCSSSKRHVQLLRCSDVEQAVCASPTLATKTERRLLCQQEFLRENDFLRREAGSRLIESGATGLENWCPLPVPLRARAGNLPITARLLPSRLFGAATALTRCKKPLPPDHGSCTGINRVRAQDINQQVVARVVFAGLSC